MAVMVLEREEEGKEKAKERHDAGCESMNCLTCGGGVCNDRCRVWR